MISLISPTGRGIRSDGSGDGHYGAKRGDRIHKGIDFLCTPGQDIIAPVSGFITRIAYPYGDDLSWKGIVLQGEWCRIKMFYLETWLNIPTEVFRGEVIGKAQDISRRYGGAMLPHIHLEFDEIIPNPELFMEAV